MRSPPLCLASVGCGKAAARFSLRPDAISPHGLESGGAMREIAERTENRFVDGYWLRRCEGFRVESPNGRIGFVEEVVGRPEQPEALLIRAGLLGARVLIVPVTEIVALIPSQERVVLRGSPQIRGSAPRHGTPRRALATGRTR